MTNKNHNTTPEAPQPQGQANANHEAFVQAFIQPDLTLYDRLEVFLDLQEAGDDSAAALCIGDLIMQLDKFRRETLLDLLTWLLRKERPGDALW